MACPAISAARALILAAVLGLATGLSAADIVVSTAADIVNGSISTPDALRLSPGPDGISLREALLAANNVPGPHSITFEPTLAGQTITLATLLPTIVQSGVTITGITTALGQPAVTLDAGGNLRSGFDVSASDFTITHMRVVRVHQGGGAAVQVIAGITADRPRMAVSVENIKIDDNVFDNTAIEDTGFGVRIGLNRGSSGGIVRNVEIARNEFAHYAGDGDAVHIEVAGTAGVIQDVVIESNSFSDTSFPVEMVHIGVDNKLQRVTVRGNTFVRNLLAIPIATLGSPGAALSGNIIEDTAIVGNTFQGPGLSVYLLGGVENDSRNIIRNTRIAGNRFLSTGGINLAGGTGTSTENRVEQTLIVNNTFISTSNSILISGGGESAQRNVVTGTKVLNNRFTLAAGVNMTGGRDNSSENLVEDTLIFGNMAVTAPGAFVLLTGGGNTARHNSIRDTRIENNYILKAESGVGGSVGRDQAFANRIERLVVSGNIISAPSATGFQIIAGSATATANEAAGIQLVNNLIIGTQRFGAANLISGGQDNRISGALLANNTLVQNPGGGIGLMDSGIPGSIADVRIVNTILWNNSPDLRGVKVDQVRNCITADPQFKGVNGNLGADPLFMDAAHGDFYLRPGSPAIDTGTSEGAPLKDIEGRDRFDDPATSNRGSGPTAYYDMGAYEFNGPVLPFGISGVVNSASFAAGLVPGGLATIFGRGLVPVAGAAAAVDAPAEGIAVKIGGRDAALLSIAKQAGLEQINVQAPFEVPLTSTALLEVDNHGMRFSAPAIPLFQSQPGIFEITLDSKGTRVAAASHLDGTPINPSNPARTGEIVSLFLTGAGPVQPEVATGAPGPTPPATTVLPAVVGVADVGARVFFSGYVPQAIGLYQVNFEIPFGIAAGPSVKLNVKIGDNFSQASSIAIQTE